MVVLAGMHVNISYSANILLASQASMPCWHACLISQRRQCNELELQFSNAFSIGFCSFPRHFGMQTLMTRAYDADVRSFIQSKLRTVYRPTINIIDWGQCLGNQHDNIPLQLHRSIQSTTFPQYPFHSMLIGRPIRLLIRRTDAATQWPFLTNAESPFHNIPFTAC